MMRQFWIAVPIVGFCALALGRSDPVSGPKSAPHATANAPQTVSLIYTTALLGNLTHCACGGVNQGGTARIATVVERLRSGSGEQRKPGVLIVDAGSYLEPNFPHRHVQLTAVSRFLDLAGYDVVNAEGNAASPEGRIPRPPANGTAWTCANVLDAKTKQPLAAPFVIKNVAEARLAVVGLASSESAATPQAPPSPYAPSAQFYASQAQQFKTTLLAELRQSSPPVLEVFGQSGSPPGSGPLGSRAVLALLKEYPLSADRTRVGASKVAALLNRMSNGTLGAKEAQSLLALDRKAAMPGNAEARRTVIRSLVADLDRFEKLSREWTAKERSRQLATTEGARLAVADPIETLKSLLPKLRNQSDAVVVLSQCGLATDRKLAAMSPGLIIIGGVGASVLKQPEQVRVGDGANGGRGDNGVSWLLPTSTQGAEVCTVTVEVGRRQEAGNSDTKSPRHPVTLSPIRVNSFRRHPVIPGVPEDPRVLKVLDDYFAELAHQAQRVVRQMPPGRRFVGSAKCITCHEKDGKVWKASTHAHAVETLTAQMKADGAKAKKKEEGSGTSSAMLMGHGQKFPIGRINECYLCHRLTPPEGFASFNNGKSVNNQIRNPKSAIRNLIEGVGCESCHGAGELHAQDGKRPIPVARPGEATCLSCHTPTRSPKYEFAKFWEKIRH